MDITGIDDILPAITEIATVADVTRCFLAFPATLAHWVQERKQAFACRYMAYWKAFPTSVQKLAPVQQKQVWKSQEAFSYLANL